MGKKFVSALFILFFCFCWKVQLVNAESATATLHLVYGQHQFHVPLKETGFDGIDPTTLNRKVFFQWIKKHVESQINRPAHSAFFKDEKVQDHQTGRKVDHKRLDRLLDYIHFYTNRPVLLPVNKIHPQLTTSECMRLKEKLLGQYTTRFNSDNVNRTHNIYLSSKSIDHYIVMPGEIFSFNRVVGPRLPQKGYRSSRIIVKGEYSEGIGGGICQTSSTLYNSTEQAGLEIVKRHSHSKHVPYVPKQRDATVSWGSLDFCFRNQLNEPIVIVSKIYGGSLSISIFGPSTTVHNKRFVPKPPQ